jgi:hypothetical protein
MGHYDDCYEAEEMLRKEELKPLQDKLDNFISSVRKISLSNLTIGDVYDLITILSSTGLYDVRENKARVTKILKNIKRIRKE